MFEYSDIGSMALGLTEGVAVVDHDDVGKSEPWDGDYRDHTSYVWRYDCKHTSCGKQTRKDNIAAGLSQINASCCLCSCSYSCSFDSEDVTLTLEEESAST